MPKKISEEDARKAMLDADLVPLVAYRNSSTPWHSTCGKCKQEVSPTLSAIKSGQGGCGFCAGNRVNVDDAVRLMRKFGYEPVEEYPGNKKPWKCIHLECGEIVYPKYNSVQQRGVCSCKKCSKMYVNPIEARTKMVAAGVIPQEPYPGKDAPWKCLCVKCNQIITSRYSTIRDGGGGCKKCANRETAVKRRYSPEQVRKDYLKVNLEVLGVYTNTDVPLLCKCIVCGNFPSPTYTSIRAGSGCRYCSEKLIAPENAVQLALKVGLEPLEDFVSGQVPWKCRHKKCNEIVYPLFLTIKRGGTGCVRCNSKEAALRYKFSEEKAYGIMLEAQIQPLEPYVNALTPWKSKCLKCGNIINPKLNNIQNGAGCRFCTEYGFKLDLPGYVYVVFHPELNSIKIGIGNHSRKIDRIETHQRYGWLLFKKLESVPGSLAIEIEDKVFHWIRFELNLDKHLIPEQMPQGGHTETVDASEIDLPTIWKKIEQIKLESNESR